MNAYDFVRVVRATAPDRGSLVSAGLEAAEIGKVLQMFTCPERAAAVRASSPRDELERLLAEYDCSRLEIGVFRFVSPASSHESGRLVGYLEADAVTLGEDGRVGWHDHHDGGRAPGVVCAQSGAAFLDALAHRVRGRGAPRDSVAMSAACARRAGVAPASAFWAILGG